jgi:hypothetical protein
MAGRPCARCGELVYPNDPKCPNCGRRNAGIKGLPVVPLVIGVIVLLGLALLLATL